VGKRVRTCLASIYMMLRLWPINVICPSSPGVICVLVSGGFEAWFVYEVTGFVRYPQGLNFQVCFAEGSTGRFI